MNGKTTIFSRSGAAVKLITPIFVDRERQRSIIDTALKGGDTAQHPRVIEFYGVAGIGKSRILEEVKNKCRKGGIPFIGIDFMLAETFDSIDFYHSYKLDILLRFCDQLDHHVDAAHSAGISRARAEISEALRLISASDSASDLLVDRCCNHLANALQSKNIVFMFDSFDLCPDDIIKWLWDSVLVFFERAASRTSVIVFVAGRRQRFSGQ
jgi:hypothetical protein